MSFPDFFDAALRSPYPPSSTGFHRTHVSPCS